MHKCHENGRIIRALERLWTFFRPSIKLFKNQVNLTFAVRLSFLAKKFQGCFLPAPFRHGLYLTGICRRCSFNERTGSFSRSFCYQSGAGLRHPFSLNIVRKRRADDSGFYPWSTAYFRNNFSIPNWMFLGSRKSKTRQ